jgi:hypothetical protein
MSNSFLASSCQLRKSRVSFTFLLTWKVKGYMVESGWPPVRAELHLHSIAHPPREGNPKGRENAERSHQQADSDRGTSSP